MSVPTFSDEPLPGGLTREHQIKDNSLTISIGADTAMNRIDRAFDDVYSQKAAPNGLASLDSNGQVPASQIPSVPVGSLTTSLIAGQNINAFQAVAVHADGQAYLADAGTTADINRIVGVALNSASTGNAVEIIQLGTVSNNGFLFTPGQAVYLGLAGALVQVSNSGAFELALGIALSSSKLALQIDKASAIIFA